MQVKLPDVGEEKVQIIEIYVKEGDIIAIDDPLIVVETEKASMDIPSSHAGIVQSIKINSGDYISQGDIILEINEDSGKVEETSLETNETQKEAKETIVKSSESNTVLEKEKPKENTQSESSNVKKIEVSTTNSNVSAKDVYASPSVRRMARVYGVDLSKVQASGEKNRILKEDIQLYIKSVLSTPNQTSNSAGINLPQAKEIDFSKFGDIEIIELGRIQKISGPTLHRNWVSIPHVTQFDETDITDLESFRKIQNEKYKKTNKEIKISPIIFVLKAVAKNLELYPKFNTSLSVDGQNIIYKKYINIGVAVDTPNGLVVPVIKDVNKKGIEELSHELAVISKKARDGKLTAQDMQGGCFTISSLGGIGGTLFTPIINAPEVAILGLSKSEYKPKWNGTTFDPRLMLPLSLSYDHRVIDGADGARFITSLNNILNDIKTILL